MRFFTTAAIIASIISSAAAQQQVFVKPAPTWVKDLPYPIALPDTSSISGGYYYLLLEKQYNLPGKQVFRRYATKVISEKGLPVASAISESFDPAFQTMSFHSLLIHRHGKTLNKLDRKKMEVVRREENMERYVYDKSLTAIVNLEDVQVGDIVEYSVSTSGINPIFAPYYSNSFYFNYSEPIGKITYRLITDNKLPIQFKYFNNELTPEVIESKNSKTYHWEKLNVAALHTEDNTPSWYDPYDYVQFTNAPSWKEIRLWGEKIFKVEEKDNAVLAGKIREINNRYQTLEDKILACIRFSQEDIRYLSFSDGIHSHKPHMPNQVAQQKFGDCKDKSLLLSHMLNSLGVESHPALVTTDNGHTLPQILPDPWAFNHCIVQFTYEDSVHWIDPTLNPQVGKLNKLYFPDYKNALVIDSKTEGLTPITFGIPESMIDVKEEYFIDDLLGTSATLKVYSEYRGDEADEMRSYKASSSQEEINKSYLNFYANDFVDIERVKDVQFQDDKNANIITSTEEYFIKNFWTYDSATSKNTAQLYARTLATYLSVPSTKVRKMPLRITYPRKVFQSIKLHFPETWDVKESNRKIESEGFTYRSSISYWDNTASLRYSYVSKSDFIPAAASRKYVESMNEVRNDLTFSLTFTPKGAQSKAPSYAFVVIALITGVALYFIGRKIYVYNPSPLSPTIYFDQIGGWLMLLAVGVCLNPIISIASFFKNGYFNAAHWQTLSDSTFASYNPGLGLFVLMEMIVDLTLCGFSVLLVIVFIQRRSSVPQLVSAFLLLNITALILNQAGGIHFDLFDETQVGNNLWGIGRSMISAFIWIPYLFKSERSRGTFTVML
jgi:transglutaminase-like putative cysteine protease